MSSFSDSEVKAIIARAVGKTSVKILNNKLKDFTNDKCGILGEHRLLRVKCEDQKDVNSNNRVKKYKFFVKLLGDLNKLPKHLDVDVFEEEIKFYNEVLPLMLADYNGEKWCAECYLAKSGALVLEDLRHERGFSMRLGETMDENTLKSALTALARFHACSVIAEVKVGKSLNEAFPKFFSEKICNDNYKFGQGIKLGFETQILMAEKLGLDASFVLPNVYNHVSRLVTPQKGELNVICHNDLSKFNIMFNAEDTAIIIDYQLIRYAPPVIDVSTLLHLNTTPEFRKTSTMDAMKHYYSVFRDTLQQNKITIDIPSYENMLAKYHKYKIVGMAYSVSYLASLYLDSDLSFKIWNDATILEKFLLHSRIDLLGPKLETDVEYARKMKAVLSEYLDEAKRVMQV